MIKEPIKVELELTQREYVLLRGALEDSIDYYEDKAEAAKEGNRELQEKGFKEDIERIKSIIKRID